MLLSHVCRRTCQVLLMFGPEYARSCGIEALEPLGVYLPGDKNYPGKSHVTVSRRPGRQVALCGTCGSLEVDRQLIHSLLNVRKGLETG